MLDDVRIASLHVHLEHAPVVAAWHWREWGASCSADPQESEARWRERLVERSQPDRIPFTLAAWLGDEPVGALSVCHDDLDERYADEGPWLSGMYVVGGARDQGVGRALLQAAEARARALGEVELWAHTGEAARFYERCGWELVVPKHGLHDDAVLRRTL